MNGFKTIFILFIMICVLIFCWNISYDIIGYPHGAEFILCGLLTIVLFAVFVTIGTFIIRAFNGDKSDSSESKE